MVEEYTDGLSVVEDSKNSLFDQWYADKSNMLSETDHVVVYVGKIVRAPGHLLVVPKQPANRVSDLDNDTFVALWKQVYASVDLLKDKRPCKGCYVAQNDELWKAEPDNLLHVKQVHVHIIPATDELDFSKRLVLDDEEIKEIKNKLAN